MVADAPTPTFLVSRRRLQEKFHDFDDPEVYHEYKERAVAEATKNFVVQFGPKKVQIAVDLDADEIDRFLRDHKDADMPIRWINIWDPSVQADVVGRIGNHYKFSSRLTQSIAIWDKPKKTLAKAAADAAAAAARKPTLPEQPRRRAAAAGDVEQGLNGQAVKLSAMAPVSAGAAPFCTEDVEMFKLIHNALNYTTIDHGQRFICIGANWLHARPEPKTGRPEPKAGRPDKKDKDSHHEGLDLVPPKHWSWFALTHESTVLSFQEAPYYEYPAGCADREEWRRLELEQMRLNTYNLLVQLSERGLKEHEHRFATSKAVRRELKTGLDTGGRAHTATPEPSIENEGSTNLFFYLFEDYSAAVSILNKTNKILRELTNEVLHITDRKNKGRDTSYIIRRLYDLSRELRQLRHLFESYAALIKRITQLEVEKNDSTSASGTPNREVKLSQIAKDRFERLKDRLQLLMLSSIDECLEEKTSLSDTYFNLLSQNDSQATSRLTRSATMLAKLSVFFLPISFMTSYFSIQVPHLFDRYTGSTYWVTFAVIAALSFISLFFFGRVLEFFSDVLDERARAVEDWLKVRPWRGLRQRGREKEA